MGGYSDGRREYPQKVERTESRDRGGGVKVDMLVAILINPQGHLDGAASVARADASAPFWSRVWPLNSSDVKEKVRLSVP